MAEAGTRLGFGGDGVLRGLRRHLEAQPGLGAGNGRPQPAYHRRGQVRQPPSAFVLPAVRYTFLGTGSRDFFLSWGGRIRVFSHCVLGPFTVCGTAFAGLVMIIANTISRPVSAPFSRGRGQLP